MRKTMIKRVFLVGEDQQTIILSQDFIGTLSDDAILDALYEVGKNVWIGSNLYHIVYQDNMVRHLRYEIVPVVQYEKTWFDYLLDAVRRA